MFRHRSSKTLWSELVLLLGSFSAAAQPIHPGKTGAELEGLVRAEYRPTTVLGYVPAKRRMFTSVDNAGGRIRLIYSGDTHASTTVPT